VREVHLIQWERPRLVVGQRGNGYGRASALGRPRGYAYAEGFDEIRLPA
jgi:hypothetical protein